MGSGRSDDADSLSERTARVGGRVALGSAGYVQDGWRSWCVLGGTSYFFFVYGGFLVSAGTYFDAWEAEWGSGAGASALPLGLLTGTASGFGLVSASLFNQMGARLCLGLGWWTGVLALLAATASPSLAHLCAATTLLGVGLSLCNVAGHAVLVEYFTARRGFAVNFPWVVAALGQLALPHAHFVAVHRFAWRGAFLILTGLFAPVAAAAAFTASRRAKVPKLNPISPHPNTRKLFRTFARSGVRLGVTCCEIGSSWCSLFSISSWAASTSTSSTSIDSSHSGIWMGTL